MLRRASRFVLTTLAVLALLAAGVWLARDALLQAGLEWALARFGERLVVEAPQAAFSGRVAARRLTYRDQGIEVAAEAPEIVLDLRMLWRRELLATRVGATRLAVRIEAPPAPQSDAPAATGLPDDLRAPLPLAIDALAIGQLDLSAGDFALRATEMRGALRFDGRRWSGEALRATVALPSLDAAGTLHPCDPGCELALDAGLDARTPFALEARLAANGRLQGEALGVRVELGGALRASPAAAAPEGAPLRVVADARWRSFELRLDAAVDPFEALARGEFTFTDGDAGAIDLGRSPIARAIGRFDLDRTRLLLSGLELHDRKDARPAVLTGNGELALNGLEGRFELRIAALDAARLHTALVPSRLSGQATLGVRPQRLSFEATLRQADAPLAAEIAGVATRDAVRIERLVVDAYGGHAEAGVTLGLGGSRPLAASVRFDRFDASRLARLPPMRLAGRAKAKVDLAAQPRGEIELELADSRLAGRVLALQARARGTVQAFDLQLDGRLGDSRLSAQGRLDGDRAGIAWRATLAQGELVDLVDPGLRGGIEASGKLSGAPLAPRFELNASAPQLQLGAQQLRSVSLRLAGDLAKHRLELAGRLGPSAFTAVAEGGVAQRLDALGADSRWSGRLEALSIDAPLATRLTAPATLTIGAGSVSLGATALTIAGGRVELGPSRVADGAVESSGRFHELAVAPWLALFAVPADRAAGATVGDTARTDRATAKEQAAPADRAAGATASPARFPGANLGTDLVLAGAWSLRYRVDAPAGERLQGRFEIERSGGDLWLLASADGGTTRARQPMALQRLRAQGTIEGTDARLSVALGSARGTEIDADARITLDLEQPLSAPQELSATARLRGLEIARWIDIARPGLLDARLDAAPLRLGAGATLHWRPRSGAPDALRGDLFVERESGDVAVTAAGSRIALELETARIELSAADGTLQARAQIESRREASLKASGQAALAVAAGRIAVDRRAPWKGRLDGTVDLGPISAVLSDDLQVGGNLAAAIELSGTPQQPLATGQLNGDGLRVTHPESGLRLVDGRLRAVLAGERIEVNEWTMFLPDSAAPEAGARPRVSATGALPLDPRRSAYLDFRAERLGLPIAPEQRLVVSGDGRLALEAGRILLTVQARADEATIRLLGQSRPSLSSDVVIERPGTVATERARTRQPEPPLPFSARIGIDLGDRFRVAGEGIAARLGGRLSLEAEGVDTLRARGDVNIVEGRYSQLGVTLVIERGVLRFAGPIDNPGLDIVATRENLPVRVWAQISGTAQDPVITLGSDEPMTDAERLAWLTLGAPLAEDPAAAQSAALRAAARALLGTVTGSAEGESLTQTLGIDVLAVRSDTTGASFVTVGKQVSERLFISYEQGLRGVWNIVHAQLQLSRRLQLSMQAGSESAVDLLLTVPFN